MRAVFSTAIAAVIVAFANLIFDCLWVHNHNPDDGETMREYYRRCVYLSTFVISLQFIVMMISAGTIAIIRGCYHFRAGVVSGLLLYALSRSAPLLDLYPGQPTGMPIYFLVLPLLSLGLQWWPRSHNRIIEPGGGGYGSPGAGSPSPHR